MPLVSNRVRILYFVWRRRGIPASYSALRDELRMNDERQLRNLVPRLIAENELEVKKRKGQDYWHVTTTGLRKISFLTLPFVAYALLLGIGVAFVAGGLVFGLENVPITWSGQAGVGLFVAILGGFLLLNQRRLEKELFNLGSQDDSDQG